MKKELLRINHLNCTYTPTRKLENVSFCILEGECIGFLGLTYSGKDLLSGILRGKLTEGKRLGTIYVDGEKIDDWEILNQKIYCLRPDNYIIEDWTVAEYLCLVDSGWSGAFWRRNRLEEEAEELFSEFDLMIEVSERMKKLSESEKRIVDIVKAYWQGAKIMIIEDEFEGMSQDDIIKFGKIMHRLIAGKMGVIINSNSNFISSALSDKYVIFNKGHIVKKCAREYIKTEEQLEQYLLGNSEVSGKSNAFAGTESPGYDDDVVYRVRNLKIRKDYKETFDFIKGEVVTILVQGRREKEQIFLTLSGREQSGDTYYILNGKRHENMDCYELAGEKIVSIRALGSREEVFEHMTVEENLMLPSLKKISFWDYLRASNGIQKMMLEELGEEQNIKNIKMEELGSNERIRMTLERWYIFNPKVLILFEPFALCDVNDVAVVKKYVKKFSNKGTTVIIVNTREEYVEDISNRIIRIR